MPSLTVRTFLIADVRGYTRFTSEHGDEAAAHLAERFAFLCEDVMADHNGQVIELRGDEALCVFASARDALRGAVALQGAFKDAVTENAALPLNVGMGLDAGEAIPVRGGYRGGALTGAGPANRTRGRYPRRPSSAPADPRHPPDQSSRRSDAVCGVGRGTRDAATLSQYESVALFIRRAKAAKDAFTMTDENAPAVADICSRLDGLPLAIELAAARIKLFPPQALLLRIDRRLKLLTGGARDRPGRQQTLRGAIDWSYQLLTEEERVLFARLSLFAGECTLDAVEAICGADGSLGIDAMDGISSLVEKSLVRQIADDASDEPRFAMLETIREYAAEKLAELGEASTINTPRLSQETSARAEGARHSPDQALSLVTPTAPA